MFTDWFSGELLVTYVRSVHKDRIDYVGTCLLRQRYLPLVVRQRLHEWVRFARHLEQQALDVPTSIHDPRVQDYLKVRFPTGCASRRRGIYASVRIFIDTDSEGRFNRRVRAPQQPTNTLYEQAVPSYLEFLQNQRGVSSKTVSKRAFQLGVFTRYLERVGVAAWKEVQASTLRAFLTTQLPDRQPATRLSYASTLRTFYRCAYLQGLVERDLSVAVSAVRQYRLAGVPDIMSEDEVSALLESVDRSTTVGKRDYVVLLLAARYGMRPGDIRQLRLDHIQWRRQQIALQQSKTGRLLLLPLLPEVSDALIDYLRHGRPKTEFRTVFVRHRAPYEPFLPNNNLSSIFRAALQRGGLADRLGRKGLYLLRHTLATRMLSAGSSIKTIGDVLGHVSLSSTLIYTKVDLPHLNGVAMSLEDLLR